MIGIVYTDESEASSFLKAVNKKQKEIGTIFRLFSPLRN